MNKEILEQITFLMARAENQYHQKSPENLRKLMDEAEEKAKNDGSIKILKKKCIENKDRTGAFTW